MNYDFLQNYNIPARSHTPNNQYGNSSYSTMEGAYGTYSMQSSESVPAVNTAYYGYGDSSTYNSYQSGVGGSNEYYQNSDRYIPPSRQGTSYTPRKYPYKRKSNAVSGGSAAKKEEPIAEISADGKLVMFLGRDESYPDELNSLIHPLSCELCNVKMNSKSIAKDHYESKAHDKHISSWLLKNYTQKGLTPPSIKRFVKQGPAGPDAFHCEACDLKLTSLTHANQHYAGKKHRLVIAQKGKPSGAGYYNSEGKWVRTGTKVTPKDRRFGIGDSFKLVEVLTSAGCIKAVDGSVSGTTDTISSAADTTTKTENEDPALFCSVCKINVTSALQMTMHLRGAKHVKKLKSSDINQTSTDSNTESQGDVIPPPAIEDNVLFSAINEEIKPNPTDLSMYRTPSGQYYCQTCNISMSHLPGLEQHLMGKRHLKKQNEEKAKASLNVKKK